MLKKVKSKKNKIQLIYFFRKIKGLALSGDKVECYCCGKKYRKFLPKGNGIELRENAVCPNCDSLERTRLLLFYLKNETDLFNKTNVLLHIAPENALKNIFKKAENISYINGDIDPDFADEVVDLTNVNYPDNYFDYLICSHVLGHIPDEAKAIDEMLRVLKPGGVALILTPIKQDQPTIEDNNLKTDSERLEKYGEKDLLRLHGSDFSERLKRENWFVDKIDYRTHFTNEERERFSLGNGYRELIFVCKKHI